MERSVRARGGGYSRNLRGRDRAEVDNEEHEAGRSAEASIQTAKIRSRSSLAARTLRDRGAKEDGDTIVLILTMICTFWPGEGRT